MTEGVWLGLLVSIGVGLLLYSRAVSATVSEGLSLCGNVLLPSLFPFFVLSSLLVQRCGGSRVAPVPLAFALGAVGGYPVGAKTVAQLYTQGRIGKEQAVSALRFCNNAGPAFVLGAVGVGLLNDGGLGLRLWGIHLVSALLIGLFFRLKSTPVKADGSTPVWVSETQGSEGFLQAVTGAWSAFLNVCAFVLIFSVAVCLLEQLPWVSSLSEPWDGLLYGVLELTGGAARLAGGALPRRVMLPALSFLLGWGGLSVQCQTVDLLRKAGLPCRSYLNAKLMQGILAAGLTLLISG